MRAEPDQLDRLIAAVERQANALERLVESITDRSSKSGLGDPVEPLYPGASGLVSEEAMARALNVSPRTLGRYRRQHRLPNCWLKNGKRVLWRYQETLELWKEGIA